MVCSVMGGARARPYSYNGDCKTGAGLGCEMGRVFGYRGSICVVAFVLVGRGEMGVVGRFVERELVSRERS